MRPQTSSAAPSMARNSRWIPNASRKARRRPRGALAALFLLAGASELTAAQITLRFKVEDFGPTAGRVLDGPPRQLSLGKVLLTASDSNYLRLWTFQGSALVPGATAATCDGPRRIEVVLPPGSDSAGSVVTVCERSSQVTTHSLEGATLRQTSQISTGGTGPSDIAVAVNRNYAFVSNRGSKNVTTFRIDPGLGTLSPIGSIAIKGSPGLVAADTTGDFAVVGSSNPNELVTVGFEPVTNDYRVVETTPLPQSPSCMAYAEHSVVPTGQGPGASPQSAGSAAGHEQLLYVGVRSSQMGGQDQILTYRVGAAGGLTLVPGSTPAGIFLTDIEVTYDRLFAVTATTGGRDEIRAYRRVGEQLILDASLEIPEPSVSFKQITSAPSEGRVTTLFVTGFQGGWVRSFEYTRDDDPRCAADSGVFCVNANRFEVSVDWAVPSQNRSGKGTAVPITSDTGSFWFFTANNIELVIKVVDGRAFNNFFWVFYGALSDVAYTITVTDTATGRVRRYSNPQGRIASGADVTAFPGPADATAKGPPAGLDSAGAELLRGASADVIRMLSTASLRSPSVAFRVRIDWRVPSQGTSGVGHGVILTSDTAYFWFFSPNNVEVVLKVVDGRAVNGHYWVFYGALSDVEYTITVTNEDTGVVRTYFNPSGTVASAADVRAF